MPAVAAVAAVVDEALRHGEGADGWQADGGLARCLCVTRQVQVRAGRHERLVFTRREHVSVTEHLLQLHSRTYASEQCTRAETIAARDEGPVALFSFRARSEKSFHWNLALGLMDEPTGPRRTKSPLSLLLSESQLGPTKNVEEHDSIGIDES